MRQFSKIKSKKKLRFLNYMVKNASQNYMLFYTCVTKEPTYLKSGKALTFLKTIAF